MEEYDVIVVGGGPGGMTAALYVARTKLKVLVLEGQFVGGQMAATAYPIENYPGFPDGIMGSELAEKMQKQAEKFGVEFRFESVVGLDFSGKDKKVKTGKNEYSAPAVILATGAKHRSLGVTGEEEFDGKGLSYCEACDGPLFKDKTVLVVGGGNSAVTAALNLSGIAKKTYLAHRRDELRADAVLVDQVRKSGVEILWNTTLTEVKGDKMVSSVVLEDVNTKEKKELPMDGVFIYVGIAPAGTIAKNAGVELDEKGFVKVNDSMETNLEGIYACGDLVGGVLQVSQAVGQGCIAGTHASKYARKAKGSKSVYVQNA